jgi:hypothetical protein
MRRLNDKLFYDFNLHKLGYDFMGYYFDDKKDISYHHIQPRHYKGKTTYENGALLNRTTSHNYIHTIEEYEFDLFIELSQVLKDEHKCKAITKEHLEEIRAILECFEHKYNQQYTKRGNLIIREEYTRRRVIL